MTDDGFQRLETWAYAALLALALLSGCGASAEERSKDIAWCIDACAAHGCGAWVNARHPSWGEACTCTCDGGDRE
jgi:hypothetical protein